MRLRDRGPVSEGQVSYDVVAVMAVVVFMVIVAVSVIIQVLPHDCGGNINVGGIRVRNTRGGWVSMRPSENAGWVGNKGRHRRTHDICTRQMIWQIVKLECRCDVLPSKGRTCEERTP